MLSMFSPATPQVGGALPRPRSPWDQQPTQVGGGTSSTGSPGAHGTGQSLTPPKMSGPSSLDVDELNWKVWRLLVYSQS